MTKWEYAVGVWAEDTASIQADGQTFKGMDKETEMLNYMGSKGWELVCTSTFEVSQNNAVWTGYGHYYFKRPKQ